MKKEDKIYELRIDEEDEISGIDSISLVDEPAIEVNWVAFNKQKPQEFHIPDGEDEKYIEMLMDKGQPEEELSAMGWIPYSIEIDGKEDFVSTDPNGDSNWDESDLLIRYKYILSPRISGESPVIPTTRRFCRDLIAKNYVWRVEDMDATQNDFGESAMVWRGGYNCRHNWAKIKYKKDAKIVNKASVNKGKETVGGFPTDMVPDLSVIGYEQPLTVTDRVIKSVQEGTAKPSTIRNLGLSKEKFELPMFESKETAESYAILIGCSGSHEHMIGDKVLYMPCEKHPEDLGYDNTLPPYVDQLPTGKTISEEFIECKKCGHSWDMKNGGDKPYLCNKCGYNNKPQDFASYSDYPQGVKDAAQRVLNYVEENGWGSCGTAVGKQRANQLAKGEAISLETVMRMYSYLSRHKVDLERSKSYDDGCGKLMYDSWGGEVALRWAERKIAQVQAGAMSKQRFAADDEKRIVVGPAMVPNLKIFRKDKKGNPYYVYFTEETIKMIAEKYMKNKYTDNNDKNHDGKAVEDVYVIESWIKEDMEDKSNKYGYEDLPIGTWFVSMKVKNDEVWNMVKEGKLNGFSVSGYFEEIAEFCKEEMFLRQVADILKNIK